MKVAICFSGFIRSWQFNKDTFINVFCKGLDLESNVDIFVHAYLQNIHEWSSTLLDQIYTEEEIREMFKGLPVKKFIFENRTPEFIQETIIAPSLIFCDIDAYCPPKLESGTILPQGCRIYDQMRVIELINNVRIEYEKENNIKYDLVVKTRFDLFYHTSPDWQNYQKFMDNEIHSEIGANGGYPWDCSCISTPFVMDNCYAKRCSLLEEMYSKCSEEDKIFDAHQTITLATRLTNIPFGTPSCVCSLRRDETYFHVPFLNENQNLETTKNILKSRYGDFDINAGQFHY